MILGLASLVCGFLWGFLADLIGRKRAMVIILVIQAVAYAMFALVDRHRGRGRLGGALRPHRLGHPGHHGGGLRGHGGAADGPGRLRLPHGLPRLRTGRRALRGRASWPTPCPPSPPAT